MLQKAMEGTIEEMNLSGPLDLLKRIGNRKAELQLQTSLQNVWAAIGHDRLYKSEFKPPSTLDRQLHRVAALLEDWPSPAGPQTASRAVVPLS